jgi:hypothetical protein
MKDMKELFNSFERAQAAYDSAHQEASFARSRECDALNQFNAAQKAIDAALDEHRKKSPRDSDWHRLAFPPKLIAGIASAR